MSNKFLKKLVSENEQLSLFVGCVITKFCQARNGLIFLWLFLSIFGLFKPNCLKSILEFKFKVQ